jgi:hypothetical protein
MHSRILTALIVAGLALAGCSSDGDDGSPSGTSAASTDTGTTESTMPDPSPTGQSGVASIELTDDAPADADIVIAAGNTTTDRVIRRGGQSAIEQGQTFAVDADSSLTRVSFHVAAPDGVAAGTPVQLAVYEVGNTVTMVPSGPVDLGNGANEVVAPLPDAIEPGTTTHLVFSLAEIIVAPGQYAVVLSFGDGAPAAEMYLQHPDGDVYADGAAISLEGAFWKSNTNDHDSAVTLTFGR